MTIAYIIEKLSGKGGMERILTDKMNYLAEHTTHEVVAMLLWKDDKPLAYPLSEKVRVVRLDAPWNKPLVGFPLVWYRFRREIRRINPDVTIYTWIGGAFLACYGGWKGRSIFENHHTFSDMKHQGIIARAAKRVDCVVALTDDDGKAFAGAKRVEVIPNFTTIKAVSADYSSKHCLAIGRLVDVKDFPRMIRLWKQVAADHPDWVLDIVGEGPEEDVLKQMIHDEGLQNRIVMYPATDNVQSFYADSSIYLMTSKQEGLPMVLLEAQACGLPLVAFDCEYGPRYVISDAVNGCLIPYDDDNCFVDKLSLLMNDEALRKRMGESARTASQHYQPQAIMEKWLQLLKQ